MKNYIKSLIESIMEGIDLPKLYIGEIDGMGKCIIDGGHRTRAISAYFNNEFPISVEKISVYYDTVAATTKSSRVMNKKEKEHIENSEFFNRMRKILGDDFIDPHGSIIPESEY